MISGFFLAMMFVCVAVLVQAAPSSGQESNSTVCDRFCGGGSVPYPFTFTDGCGIKLNCTGDAITIGGFTVKNLTADQILIKIPSICNRSIGALSWLFGENFAPTWRNGLLLENCSSRLDDCVIPSKLIRSIVGFDTCDLGARNDELRRINCYSEGLNDLSEFLTYENVKQKGNCTVLFSSVMVNMVENSRTRSGSSTLALEFQTVELGWWVSGQCNCHPNATCFPVENGNDYKGFRCQCNEGFTGDGFAEGEGCRRDSHCSTSVHFFGQCGAAKVGILIGGILAGTSLVTALFLAYYIMKKRVTYLDSGLSVRRLITEAAGNSRVPFYPYKEIERATNGFSEKQRLGNGAYGTVYAGKLHSDEWVAIKKIRYRDRDSAEQVMNEIKLLSSVNHPSLVRLLGCCVENGEQILVYEYMPNGTLCQHLQRERGSVLPWTIRLTIAAETAKAIAHLHSAMDPPIYHRDIKSSNILLDFNFNSKVADFGLSRIGMIDDSHISTAPQGTPGYVDPQYHQNFHLSDKSDVYSFGVVLVEIISAMKVVDFSRPHSDVNLAALAIDRIGKGRLDEIIDPHLEPNRDAWTLSSVHKVAEIAFRCLAFHRDMRPSMTEVADELEEIRQSSWAPLEENVHTGSSVASSCSSLHHGSVRSFNVTTIKKGGVSSTRVIVPQKATPETTAQDAKDCSPVSVQDPWLSNQSSPSTNALLAKVSRD